MAVLLVAVVTLGAGLFIEAQPKLGAWMDFITVDVVPFGALLGAIMIYWVLGCKKIDAELNLGRVKPLGKAFDWTAKYLYVGLSVLVFVLGIVLGGIG